MKPGIDDKHQVIVDMSNDLWFLGMEVKAEETKRQNAKETEAHIEGMVLRRTTLAKPSESTKAAGEKSTKLVDRMIQATLEVVWTEKKVT